TWLYQEPLPPVLEVTDFNIVPSTDDIDLPDDIIQIDKGAYFNFVSSLSGPVKLSIDIDHNGSYTDPIDWVYYEKIEPGIDSVFWPVENGFGQALQPALKLEVFYKMEMYGGELHILMSDIENMDGGVNFTRINGANSPERFHFYDHSNVDGPVSGGGTPGNALQTSVPFGFDNLWGDSKLLDYWSYVAFLQDEGVYIVNLVTDYNDFCAKMNQASLQAVENTVCKNEVITLHLEAVDTSWIIADKYPVYLWLNANGDTIHTGLDTSFSFNSQESFAISPYQIVATNFGCSSPVSEPISITVQDGLDSLYIVSSDTICPNQSFQLNTQSLIGTTYEWRVRGDSTLLSTEQNPVFENYPNTTTFELTVNTQQCVPNPVLDYTIYVKTPPDAPKPRDRMLQHCEGEDATIFINTSPGATFKWYFENPDNQIGLGLSPFLEINDLNADNAGVYWFTSSIDGCESALSDSVFLIVDTIPANKSVAGLDIEQCGSTLSKLHAVAPSVGTGFWTSPTGARVANPDLPNTDVAELSLGDNLFIWTLSNGACEDYDADSMYVNLSSISTDIADAGTDIALCLDGSTTLNATALQTATGFWTQSEEQKNAGVKISDPTIIDPLVSGMQPGLNYTFTWTLSEGSCLDYSRDSVKVRIDEIPNESAFLPNDEFSTCNDEGLEIAALPPTQSTGRWANYSGASIANSNSPTTFVNNMQAGLNYFTWLLSNGACVDFDSVQLSVYKEQPPLAVADKYTTPFETVLKGENLLDNDQFFDISDWTLSLLQTTQSGTLVLNIDGTFIYTPDDGFSGQDYFIYQICNENCEDLCDSTRVDISVSEPVVAPIPCIIPEAITPNGDHANDVLDIPCLEQYPNNNIKIFNRWGKKIYEADNYQNDWAGTFNGKELPTGTYFYIIKTKADSEEFFQGYFMIVR
ncbi:MAG TPA: T9SS type B sorting domain-containing protein, partial [Saprospiraceae bacterium]|nr:T9SS type B sorting domain-containing protein [Saprospiraceae bacterium]